jgi:hypothetical protein
VILGGRRGTERPRLGVSRDLVVGALAAAALAALLVACGSAPAARSVAATAAPTGQSVAPAVAAVDAVTSSFVPSQSPVPSATARPATDPGPTFWVRDDTIVDDSHPDPYLSIQVTAATFGSLAAQTAAAASCVSTGNYPSGKRIVTSGLGPRQASASGVVRWSFIAAASESGTATYALSCSANGSTRTVTIFFPMPY